MSTVRRRIARARRDAGRHRSRPARPCLADTNAWAQHWKRFRRLITVRGSYIVLTAPAPDKLEEIRWTNGMGLWDHRAALHYVRTTPDGRIAFGVGGMQPGLARSIGPRFSWDERAVRHRCRGPVPDVPVVRRRADRGGVGWTDRRGRPPPAVLRLPGAGATCTTGTATPGTASGRLISGDRSWRRWRWGRTSDLLSVCRSSPSVPMRFPPEPIRSPGAYVANQAIWRKDQLEDQGRGAESHRGLRRAPPAPDGVQPGPVTDRRRQTANGVYPGAKSGQGLGPPPTPHRPPARDRPRISDP